MHVYIANTLIDFVTFKCGIKDGCWSDLRVCVYCVNFQTVTDFA